MDGIYTLWSAPSQPREPRFSRLEAVLLALSVLEWRRWNGRALLFCDPAYARSLESLGLLDLWDEADSTIIARANSLSVKKQTFWTLGRLVAIAEARIPFMAVDYDLVVWRSLAAEISPGQIGFTHWEWAQDSPWYPDPQSLSRPDSYEITPRDWSSRAINISLTYFGSEIVRDSYVENVLRFMIGNPAEPDPELAIAPELLFAEQRLMPAIAAELGVLVKPFIDATWAPALGRFTQHDERFGEWDPLLVNGQSTGITHAWFYKRLMSPSHPRLGELAGDLTARLESDYPQVAETLAKQGITR